MTEKTEKKKATLSPEYADLHPLFWDSIPEGAEDHPDIEALRHLDYEGTPEEVAENWKEKGNKAYSKEKYDEAINCYTEALKINSVDKKAVSVYYSNRAATNLALKNYGKVLEDCKSAIELDDTNLKTYWRATRAAFELEKWKDAWDFCTKGLQKDPLNKTLLGEKQKIDNKVRGLKQKKEAKKKEDKELLDEYAHKKQKLEAAFTSRGIKMGKAVFNTQNHYGGEIFLDDTGELHWPVMILYEEHNQSDFIKDFNEEHCFRDHLSVMFPPGEVALWDEEKKYKLDDLEIYFETGCVPPLKPTDQKISRRWIKVRQTTPLKKVISHPDYVVPQFPVFYIVVANSKFKELFLTRPLE